MYARGEELLHNDTLRENIHVRRHESGLQIYFCPKPGFEKRYACFATSFGSVDVGFSLNGGERRVPEGIAHFLEHQLFEGENANALELFSRNGASANAYTGFTVTNYLFSCGDSFFDHLGNLIDFVLTPHFLEENVKKEQGIIAQEIRMYQDSPGWKIFFNLLGCLYKEHPIKEDIAGTVESIGKIDHELLYECYNTFYHPRNMILFAIGDEDKERFFEAVDTALSTRSFGEWREIRRVRPDEPPALAETKREEYMEVSMPRLLLGFKDRSIDPHAPQLLERELSSDILLEIAFGKASSFYQKLYERQLIDDGFSASYSGYEDVGHSMVGGETPDPERLAREILDEVRRLQQTGVPREDFERQRRAVMGEFLRHFNSLEFIANNFTTYRFQNVNLFSIIDALHAMRIEDLDRRLREHLVEDAAAISIVYPKAAKKK